MIFTIDNKFSLFSILLIINIIACSNTSLVLNVYPAVANNSLASFKVKGRNTKGVKYMNITAKSGNPVALSVCSKDEDLVVVTDKGMIIRTELKNISVIGRDTQGVCIIKLNEGHKVASIVVVPSAESTKDIEEE